MLKRLLAFAAFVALSAAVPVSAELPPPGVYGGGTITLYMRNDFQGPSRTFSHDHRTLESTGFNDMAWSAIVRSSRWQLCTNRDFSGHCVILGPGRYPTLQRRGLGGNISSLRRI